MNGTYKVIKCMHIREIGLFGAILVLIGAILAPMLFAQPEPRKVMAEEALSSAFTKIVKQNDGTLFVLGKYNWLLKGSPDAQQWERVQVPVKRRTQVVDIVCNGDSGLIVRYDDHSLFRSLDNGRTWGRLEQTFRQTSYYQSTPLPNRRFFGGLIRSDVYPNDAVGLLISHDFGSTWDSIIDPYISASGVRLQNNILFCSGRGGWQAFNLDNGTMQVFEIGQAQQWDAALIGSNVWVASTNGAILFSTSVKGPWTRYPIDQSWYGARFLSVDSTRVYTLNSGGPQILSVSSKDGRAIEEQRFEFGHVDKRGLSNLVSLGDSYLYGGEYHTLVQQWSKDSLRLLSSIGRVSGTQVAVERGVPSTMIHWFNGQPVFVGPNGTIMTTTSDGNFWVPLFGPSPTDTVANSLRGLWLTQSRQDSLILLFAGVKKVVTGNPLRMSTSPIEIPGDGVTYAFINDSTILRQYFALNDRGWRWSFMDVTKNYGTTWTNRRQHLNANLYLNSVAWMNLSQIYAVFYQRPEHVTDLGFNSFIREPQAARYELIDGAWNVQRATDIYYGQLQYYKLVSGPRSCFQPVLKTVQGPTEDGLRVGTLLKYQNRMRDPEEISFTVSDWFPFICFNRSGELGIVLMKNDGRETWSKEICRVRFCDRFENFGAIDYDTISWWSYGLPSFVHDSLVAYIADDHLGLLTISRSFPNSVSSEFVHPATLKLWPNPASQSLQISVSGTGRVDGPSRLFLVDILGQAVADLSPDLESPTGAASGELQWDFPPGLPSGTYRLVYQSGAHRVSEPLVIQR